MIRKAEISDLNAIAQIIKDAQALLKERGVDQWQDGYPDKSVLCSDIANSECYLKIYNGEVAATAVISAAGEVTYNTIEGSWLDDKPYIVIHRLAVSHKFRNRGFAKELFAFAERLCKELDIESIRVDTHAHNRAMQTLLKSLGYKPCGEITLLSGSKRIAWQLQLPRG